MKTLTTQRGSLPQTWSGGEMVAIREAGRSNGLIAA